MCLFLSGLTVLEEHRIISEADGFDDMAFTMVCPPAVDSHDLQQRS